MNNGLLILGAGQFGSVVQEIAESMQCFDRIDFLDDIESERAIGTFADCDKFATTYKNAIVAIGNVDNRCYWIEKLKKLGFFVPVLIHSKACVSSSSHLGIGTVVEPMAVVQANATIGVGSLICSGAVVKHNSVVGDYCYIDCNSTVMPEATVPSKTRVNSNTVFFFRN